MDFSVTRQLTSKIPERVSTQQIKAGLERIKRAQEQVLSELKRNHPDYSIDVRTNSQVLNQKREENYNLQKQLSVERQKSTQKSTLYRRRVVDLENSLAIHEQNEYKLKSENRALEEQLRMLKIRYSDLEKDYEKLVEESQISNRNLRNLEKEVMELAKKLQQEDVSKLRSEFTNLTAERNVIMSQKVTLLKANSKLESENIELKSKLANMAVQISQKQWPSQAHLSSPSYKSQDFRIILNEIDKMNISHQHIFTALKNNTRLPRNIMDKENQYQNSLNKILEMLHFMQKGTNVADGAPGNYKFDHEQSFKLELQRMQNQYNKKYRRDVVRHQSEKDELESKIKSRDKKIEDLQQQNQQIQMKISELRKQKSELLQEITDLSTQVSHRKQSQEKQEVKKLQEQQRKQKARDQEYRSIILQLNEQMQIIHKQKKDLDDLIGKMAQSRSEDQLKTKKRLSQMQQQAQILKSQNSRLKSKYEQILIQKQHIELSLQQAQTKNLTINKQIARQVLQKQRIISELNKLKQENEINLAQVHKYRLQSDHTKKQAQNVNNSYLLEIQRLIKEGLQLRQQIEILLQDRHQLRQLKGKYGLLMKDNQILGKKARYVNSQLDHLWMIKQVQYQNLNKIISDIKPL